MLFLVLSLPLYDDNCYGGMGWGVCSMRGLLLFMPPRLDTSQL